MVRKEKIESDEKVLMGERDKKESTYNKKIKRENDKGIKRGTK
jgi:hypothetical protein